MHCQGERYLSIKRKRTPKLTIIYFYKRSALQFINWIRTTEPNQNDILFVKDNRIWSTKTIWRLIRKSFHFLRTISHFFSDFKLSLISSDSNAYIRSNSELRCGCSFCYVHNLTQMKSKTLNCKYTHFLFLEICDIMIHKSHFWNYNTVT